MRILVVGDWHSELHEQAVLDALRSLGHEALKFSWHQYFGGARERLGALLLRAQDKYMAGPAVARLNADLVRVAAAERPDAVFVYRGSHIYPGTLRRIRAALPGTVLVGYNNDDPFSPRYPRWAWRHFVGGLREYDLALAYRQHNLAEFTAAGARRVELLRSWFVPERNHPAAAPERFACDVAFVGHYEDDGRLAALEEIARRGWQLRIFGPAKAWNRVLPGTALAAHVPVRFIRGKDYNAALCGAKIALCFFSRLNRDTYTRRVFEIPAAGTLLLCEYSDDAASLFAPDREAVFFRSTAELIAAVESLLADPDRRRAIAEAGRQRVWSDGHDVVSRMRVVTGWIEEIQASRAASGGVAPGRSVG
jgi:hypothetical protein